MNNDHNRRTFLMPLLLLTLLIPLALPGGALAASCFGKVGNLACGGPTQGYCVATDICSCTQDWSGKECEVPLFCGVTSCGVVNYGCLPPAGFCTEAGFSGTCFCGPGRSGACCEIIQSGGFLAPASLDFGSVTVGATLPAQTVFTFSNPTEIPLPLGNITLSGVNNGDFTITGGSCTPNPTVASGGSCSVSVAFTPTAPGPRSATLAVTTQVTTFFTSPLQAFHTQINVPLSTVIESNAVPLGQLITSWYSTANGARIYSVTPADSVLLIYDNGAWKNASDLFGTNEIYSSDSRLVKIQQTSSANYATTVTTAISGIVGTGPGINVRYATSVTIPPTASATLSGTGTIATSDIIVDPDTPATLYAALDGGGIYKSTNSGADWTAATTQPANKRVKALVRKNSTTLFAATYGGGVFTSSDSGANWAVCKDISNVENNGLTNLNLLSLTIDASGKLYAGSEAGVFVSADGCGTWTAMNNGLPN